MKTIEMSTSRKPLAEYVDLLTRETVVLTFHREPIAAIVSLKEVDRESLSLSFNPDFLAIIEQARQEFASGKTLSLEEMAQEVLS